MTKETKILIGAFLVTILLIIGGAFVFGSLPGGNSQSVNGVSTQAIDISANPEFYNLGEIPINGGVVTKEYEIKNTTDKSLKISRIATSCMCTEAKILLDGNETKFFGMEGHAGDKNPPINLEIGSGQTAKVIVNFDPAAHGPQGTGPFERIVWLYSEGGVKELKFNGTVIK